MEGHHAADQAAVERAALPSLERSEADIAVSEAGVGPSHGNRRLDPDLAKAMPALHMLLLRLRELRERRDRADAARRS